MGNKHRDLNKNIFRECIYIKTLERVLGIDDFERECQNKLSVYYGQYDFMYDTFDTFIDLKNCFFSDSNLSITDKVDNAISIIEKYLFVDYENSNKRKYTDRFLRDVCEQQITHIHRKIDKWYSWLN